MSLNADLIEENFTICPPLGIPDLGGWNTLPELPPSIPKRFNLVLGSGKASSHHPELSWIRHKVTTMAETTIKIQQEFAIVVLSVGSGRKEIAFCFVC